ncbi:pyridoxal-dependent decarboxylase [Solwaraspora sp. WMMD406]|uniref:pyridoxal phosphate-dependent decarboxylase family protein n=1 Tax=Solwaraspora sp. WMMD406 TaxID=3016095 RepID=UPI002416DB4E|nr:pyridoxal-dependent decarboxylase [Solwaraspora sp. WMMD406]MDG4765116.1 pyridoxal-dependent decarboxylase [Solwaraspora sp. WMMD406]
MTGISITQGVLTDTQTVNESTKLLKWLVDLGIEFKRRHVIFGERLSPEQARDLLISELPTAPTPVDGLLRYFENTVLPLCKNEASPRFLGFGDTGDDLAAMAGGLLALFTQQNLINQSFDSPSATFIEIAVLRWLRDLLGYHNQPVKDLRSVWDVGGIITHGGTTSNTVAMMLARERHAPGTMQAGVTDPARFAIIVPRGIGHYSVKSALTWIGVGAHLIEVDTRDYRYDLQALTEALRTNSDRVMAVVAYAGDSRTQTVDDLRAVHDAVRAVNEQIWLHADACWGLVCAFSHTLQAKIDGIGEYDSITVDPHKVMSVPYGLSALLVRDPADLRMISTYSDLIMQEDFAFGQVTPFIGSKGWLSLKLWMMMRAHGRSGLARIVERRIELVKAFVTLVDDHPRLIRLHDPDLVAVVFMYLPDRYDPHAPDVDLLNQANQWIHAQLIAEGTWHLHQFSIADDAGRVRRSTTLYPLRFMAANPRIEYAHLVGVLEYVVGLGQRWEKDSR